MCLPYLKNPLSDISLSRGAGGSPSPTAKCQEKKRVEGVPRKKPLSIAGKGSPGKNEKTTVSVRFD